jgi:hypothetical protein
MNASDFGSEGVDVRFPDAAGEAGEATFEAYTTGRPTLPVLFAVTPWQARELGLNPRPVIDIPVLVVEGDEHRVASQTLRSGDRVRAEDYRMGLAVRAIVEDETRWNMYPRYGVDPLRPSLHVIVRCNDVPTCNMVQRLLVDVFHGDYVDGESVAVAAVHSGIPDPAARTAALGAFQGARFGVLVVCDMLVEGWDMAEADVAVVWSDAEHLPVADCLQLWGRIGRRAGTKEVAPVVLWIQVFTSEEEKDDELRLDQAKQILRFLRSNRVTLFLRGLERCEGRLQVRVPLMATRRAGRAGRAGRVVQRRVVALENERVVEEALGSLHEAAGGQDRRQLASLIGWVRYEGAGGEDGADGADGAGGEDAGGEDAGGDDVDGNDVVDMVVVEDGQPANPQQREGMSIQLPPRTKTCVMHVTYRVSKDKKKRMTFYHSFPRWFLDCMYAMRYVMRRYEVAYREEVPRKRGCADRSRLDDIDHYITTYDNAVQEYNAGNPRFPLWPRGGERKDNDWLEATTLLVEFVGKVAIGVRDAKLPVIKRLRNPADLARFVREHLTTFLSEFHLPRDAKKVTPTGWAD